MRSGRPERCSLTERQFLRFCGHPLEDIMTRTRTLYERFEGFEEQLAHCYFLLHERFIANPPVAKFWVDSAMEELEHCAVLRLCREKGLMEQIEIDVDAADHIEQLLEMTKSIVKEPDVTIEDAFYASLLMESSEIEEIYEKLIRTLVKDHRLLYDSVVSSLRTHHDRFADGAETYCGNKTFAEAFRMLGRTGRLTLGRSAS
jgi:hypothetical protein